MLGSRSLLPPFPPDVVTLDPQNPIISVILNPESGYKYWHHLALEPAVEMKAPVGLTI